MRQFGHINEIIGIGIGLGLGLNLGLGLGLALGLALGLVRHIGHIHEIIGIGLGLVFCLSLSHCQRNTSLEQHGSVSIFVYILKLEIEAVILST